MPVADYWAARAARRMQTYERDAEQTTRIVGQAYARATRDLAEDTRRILRNYTARFDLTEEEGKAMLAQPVDRGAYEGLLAQIAQARDPAQRRALEARAASGAYASRISRGEALRLDIDMRVLELADIEAGTDTAFFERLIPEAYHRALYDIQQGTGIGFAFDRMPVRTIGEILRNPWSGATYSERIWRNTRALGDTLNETITASFLSGRSYRDVSRDIAGRMGVAYRNAERLVRTETNYMANAAEMQSYKAAGITRYRFLAILDMRTSDVCEQHDGKVYSVEDAVPGESMPPLHVNCRSTHIAEFGDDTLAELERRAIDPLTGQAYAEPAGMDYKEWRKTFLNPAPKPS
jgi:SPP1 gp7 family putative phage head morphogenesis protein